VKPDLSLERQLQNLDHEAIVIANFVYTEMAIQHAASQSRKLLSRLNRTPTFWITCNAALQSAAYIALGRVFDLKSPYNLEALMVSMEQDLTIFSREALAKRKREGRATDPRWLPEYLDAAYYPTHADVARLRKHVETYRSLYERAVMPARHQYLAHRQAHDHEKVQRLFAKGKVKEIWRLSTFLVRLQLALWELLRNGRKPVLKPVRYSARSIFGSSVERTGPHERTVRDTRELMKFIETATPNPSIEGTRSVRPPRAPVKR
jgi:hypothetical protein